MHIPIILDFLAVTDILMNVLIAMAKAKLIMCLIVWGIFLILLLGGAFDAFVCKRIQKRKK